MASTSTSSIQKSFKYDVFLSFRGEDTRKKFVDHLYHALQQKGIITYKDDEKIQKGEKISDELIKSIQDSRFYIIIFSKNYASSSWCLNELLKIMECHKTMEQTAYPVFYDVEPTEVRKQSGPFGEAFAKLVDNHEKGSGLLFFFKRLTQKRKRTLEDENEDVSRWRGAMKDAAGLAGWELKNTVNGHEAKFIQKIVIDISLKLSFLHRSVDEKLVGMDIRVMNVVSSLATGSEDVRMIGIKGIGGGGKTTLARAVFDHISIWFEGKSFVENVREESKRSLSGLKELQHKVLKDVLCDQNIYVSSVSDGKIMMKRKMPSRKALVVLDDVDDIDQLEALAGELTWFKPGSRIIITTRDEQVLKAQRVNFIHDVNLLSDQEAVCLFSRHAFGRDIPIQRYEELSGKVVHYAAGLPLTIKVLGSHLCGRSELEWVDAIERLKTIPLKETMEKLELSYNGLEHDHKEIFLDVVCLLKGEKKHRAIKILRSCGFNAVIGLRVLEQKSLITVSQYYTLGFHDHIEEMGRNIVRHLYPNEPSKHSRLWNKEEIEDILVNESGTGATRSIKLDSVPVGTTIMKGLSKMKKLRLLYLNRTEGSQCLPEDDEVSQYLPESLRSLCWPKYPCQSLPETFQINNLVNLDMRWSKISTLWEGGERKVLNKLKFLDLKYSKLGTLDLSVTPNLEVLNLKGCRDFVELQLPVKCQNLKVLSLSGSKVRNLNLELTPHLEVLNLGRCCDFEELHMPVKCPNLKVLNLSGTKVSNLNLGLTPFLEVLNLEELHMPVKCLEFKYLDLGLIPHIRSLFLSRSCYFLDTQVGCLRRLVYFRLERYPSLLYFHFIKQRESARLDSVATFKINVSCADVCPIHCKVNLPRFRFGCKYDEPRSSWSGNLEKLLSFDQCVCKNHDYFLAAICGLQHLRKLSLQGSIPQDLWRLQSLEKLSLTKQHFQHLPDIIFMLKHLKSLKLKYCLALEQLPENICEFEYLEVLRLTGCKSLQDIPNNICKLKSLKCLEISFGYNTKNLPEELGSLECLKVLDIRGAGVRRLPHSIYQLKGLRIYGSRKQLDSYGFTSLKEEIHHQRISILSTYVEL